MTLKLGIIGLSEGNGHPYSWSAIFNGYQREAMEECGFPAIPRYLEQQKWPDSQIPGARVTTIWTQHLGLSETIAKAAWVDNIARQPEDMIGEVDAILLARDDAENHLRYAEPFLKAGLPIYIDKPIALKMSDLEKLYALEQYPGQIFSCSALRYSDELKLGERERAQLGDIQQIIATTPKSWNKYAVHIIEPVLNILPANDTVVSTSTVNSIPNASACALGISWKSKVRTHLYAMGNSSCPISIRLFGTQGWMELTFTDSFSAFKKALEAFIHGIQNRSIETPRDFNARVVKIIEEGNSCPKPY